MQSLFVEEGTREEHVSVPNMFLLEDIPDLQTRSWLQVELEIVKLTGQSFPIVQAIRYVRPTT
jgi:hypothetical protein